MKITRFEDIEAWKSARQLMNLVYDATDKASFGKDPALQRQMQRATTSAMSNIAEGFDGGSDKEFRRYLRMARKSATELQSHLYVALDRKYIAQALMDALYAKAGEVRRLIGGFIKYLSVG